MKKPLKTRISAVASREILKQSRYFMQMGMDKQAHYLVELAKIVRASIRYSFVSGAYSDFMYYLNEAEKGQYGDMTGFQNLLEEEL